MSATRTIARKTYRNGGFGNQTAALEYNFTIGMFVVRAWDLWAHSSLADAKRHYRRIGR